MADTGHFLFLFTNRFPYGNDSPFLSDEIKVLSGRFEKIIIFPYKLDEEVSSTTLPANVEVVYIFKNWRFTSWKTLARYFLPFISILFYEYRYTVDKKSFLLRFSYYRSLLLQILSRAPFLEQVINQFSSQDLCYYSYWFGEWTTLLSILKERSAIDRIITRAHGFDLYNERWPGGIIPFRSFQMHWVDKVFAVSRDGYNYLQSRYPEYSGKINYSYLGVEDIPFAPDNRQSIQHADQEGITILSCSSMIPLKRVHLIAEALHHCKFPIKWIHIGDGPSKKDILEKTRDLPGHVDVELKGHLSRKQICEFYKTNKVDLFIHASEMEGLPVVMMEAARGGIPMMACDVGGVSEIVNEETGILMPSDVRPEEIAEEITKFREKVKMNTSIRLRVRQYWEKNFNASVNYNRFVDQILQSSVQR